jgi:beta-galactosidase
VQHTTPPPHVVLTEMERRHTLAPEGDGAPIRPGWPPRLDRIAYGGDYNPEQWPEEVWDEDVRLMGEAGVNMVSLGVFSWAMLEPAEAEHDFTWMHRVLERLHRAGIMVDLATPTASPPAWFTRRYPGSRPVTREGQVLGFGARQAFCPSSPEYRQAAARIVEQLATRFGDHPALVLWHVHNEYGCSVPACYCEASARAFRRWLRERYGEVATLNDAWGTTFWGQRYRAWEEIEPPRLAPAPTNPAQQLDYMRFSSDEHLACFRLERDILHQLTPQVPVTTNFMATSCKNVDYWRWAGEVDVISNDHYLEAERPDNHIGLAMAADLTRSLAGGRPWLLMEHSTGAVNWQPRNLAKAPGEMRRNSLTHVARGADGVLFFQWRASRFGAEKFHSAMLPHGGTATRTWRDVARLGRDLAALQEVRGSRVRGNVAMVWDWPSWWALELEWRPSCDLTYLDRVGAFYEALWRAHLVVDFVAPDADLEGYPLVVVPSLYLATAATASNLRAYVAAGGHLLVSFFSGIVDEHDTVHPGAYPGALRELLGLTVEEFHPLRQGETVGLGGALRGSVWSEAVRPEGAEAVLRYDDGPDAGEPAVTRHRCGGGLAWYVSTRLDTPGLSRILDAVLEEAGIERTGRDLPEGVEVVRRAWNGASYLFVINHHGAAVSVPASGTDLLTGTRHDGHAPVPPSDVVVIREEPR